MDGDLRKALCGRLKSTEGHIRGIARMIDKNRPYASVIQQIQAVQGSLKQAQLLLIRAQLDRCLCELEERDREQFQALRDELLSFLRL